MCSETRRGDDEAVITIAIDGPAGAGKSTIARDVARALGARFLDTGALYRAIALACLQRGVPASDERSVEDVARAARVELVGERVVLDGADVSERIRDRDVTEVVSVVAQNAGVRAALLERQRSLAGETDLVAEGRDMGTVVFPHAELKIFLTASLEERARRRALQLGVEGGDLKVLTEEIDRRDRADAARERSPLTRAEDAIEIDTTELSPAEVVDRIVELARSRR
jgi:cytidylate kinase